VGFGPATKGTFTIGPRLHLVNQAAESAIGFRMPPMRRMSLPILILLHAACLSADDWPQFRGPDRDGTWHETGLIDAIPAEGLKARWRQPAGYSWATPVVARGRVFVIDSLLNKPDAKERLQCFDAATGKPLWTFSYDVKYPEFAFVPGQGNGPTATPIVEGSRIWMLGINGELHCLDTSTGDVVWKKLLNHEFTIPEMVCRPSPLIEGEAIIVVTGAKPNATILALEKNTGRVMWKGLTESVLNSSPIAISVGGKRQVIAWTSEKIVALDPVTGAILWEQRVITNSNYGTATPVFRKNRLLVSGLMLEFRDGMDSPVILWPVDNMSLSKRILSNTSSPLFRDDHVYSALSRGELVCLDAQTGSQLWKTDKVTKLGNGASINLTPADDKVFLFTDEGNLILAKLTPGGYHEVSRAKVIEPTTPFSGMKAWTPPAYANGCVFVRNDKEVVCYSLKP
jgi:outer membrane protein assembly factor BamB